MFGTFEKDRPRGNRFAFYMASCLTVITNHSSKMTSSRVNPLCPRVLSAGLVCLASLAPETSAQVDPEPRQLLHLGVSQTLHDVGPSGRYLFYCWNQPHFPSTHQVVRVVIAPA